MFHQLTDGEKRGKRWICLVKTEANKQSLKNRGQRGIELHNRGSCIIVPRIFPATVPWAVFFASLGQTARYFVLPSNFLRPRDLFSRFAFHCLCHVD